MIQYCCQIHFDSFQVFYQHNRFYIDSYDVLEPFLRDRSLRALNNLTYLSITFIDKEADAYQGVFDGFIHVHDDWITMCGDLEDYHFKLPSLRQIDLRFCSSMRKIRPGAWKYMFALENMEPILSSINPDILTLSDWGGRQSFGS